MRPFYFSTCNNGAGIGAGIGAGTIHSHESTLCFPRLASNGRLFDTNTHAPHFPLALKLLVCLEDLVYFERKLQTRKCTSKSVEARHGSMRGQLTCTPRSSRGACPLACDQFHAENTTNNDVSAKINNTFVEHNLTSIAVSFCVNAARICAISSSF